MGLGPDQAKAWQRGEILSATHAALSRTGPALVWQWRQASFSLVLAWRGPSPEFGMTLHNVLCLIPARVGFSTPTE